MKNKTGKDKTTMTGREVGVLIEALRSDFRIFGEKLQALEEKFNGKIDNLENRLEGIAVNQARTLEKVTSLEITGRKIQTDIAEIKESLKDHGKRITHLEEVSPK